MCFSQLFSPAPAYKGQAGASFTAAKRQKAVYIIKKNHRQGNVFV
jgi:hypothetical protein